MSTNTKLAEALRRIVNTFPIPVEGVEQADRASLRIALFTARAALAAHDAEQAQEPISYLVRARWPDRIEEYLEVRGVTVLGVGKVGIDVDIPKLHPFGAAPVEQAQPMSPKCVSGTSEQAAKAVPADLCERICAAIKAADDKSVNEACYMLDSDDCIAIVQEQFAAPTPPAPEAQRREPLTPDDRERLRRLVIAEMDRRMSRLKTNFHDWQGWPGSWAFADVAVSALQDHLSAHGIGATTGKETGAGMEGSNG